MGNFFRYLFWDAWFTRFLLYPLVVLYLLVMLIAYRYSDNMIFQEQPASYSDDADIIKIKTADGTDISARFFPNQNANYVILYSHGNAEDLGTAEDTLSSLSMLGYAVFAYDYHGYGTSGGRPAEQALYQDIDAAYEYLTKTMEVPPERILDYGRSLGSGPAIDLAARKPVGGLILQSPFTSAFRVLTKVTLFPFDKFDNTEKIAKVQCPVLIVHGKKDRVISYRLGEELYNGVRSPKQAYWVPDADHHNLVEVANDGYADHLTQFTTLVEQAAEAKK